MRGPTHQLIGVSAGIGAGYAAGLPVQAVGLLAACSYLTSKLPDKAELRVLPHRCSLTHGVFVATPLVIIGALALAALGPVPGLVGAGAALGYLMHLAADACTVSGLPGWPLTRRVWLLPRPLRHNMHAGRRPMARRRPAPRRVPPR